MERTNGEGAVLKAAIAGFLCLLLVTALTGSAAQAFAMRAPEESAFKLGHVSVECVDASAGGTMRSDDGALGEEEADASERVDGSDALGDGAEPAQGCEMQMGEPQERSYLIANEGEGSYIRLASRTVLGELEHVNGIAVREGAHGGGEEVAGEASEAAFIEARHDQDGTGSSDEEQGSGDSDGPDADAGVQEQLWFLADDGYWYRAEPLAAGERIMVRVSVEIPFDEEWIAALSAGEPSAVVETLDVEALQARHKVIELDSADPWGTVDIEARPSDAAAVAHVTDREGGAL